MAERELIDVQDLEVHFPVGRAGLFGAPPKVLRAIDGVSFRIHRGETLGLVGESGCGKSTAGRAILNLTRPTRGRVIYDGQDLGRLSGGRMRQMRKRMQMVYQDPYASLNPRMSVRDILSEPLQVHGLARGAARAARLFDLLDLVGLDRAALDRYPHQFSGGQRQRIGIARALAVEPDFLVLDESIAALDVSIQAQIINLLKKLQREQDLTYLFISHDMAMVRHMSNRVAVMYLGVIVEIGHAEQIFATPRHPYTRALLKAVPVPAVTRGVKPVLEGITGELASPLERFAGCRFCNRCPLVMDRCRVEPPQLRAMPDPLSGGGVAGGHMVACHLAEDAPQARAG